jgi:hypothetical protein
VEILGNRDVIMGNNDSFNDADGRMEDLELVPKFRVPERHLAELEANDINYSSMDSREVLRSGG